MPRARLVVTLLAAVLALVAAVAACSGTSSTTLPPTTGILIRAETLTSGKGCGFEPTQLFKYVVVVFGYDGAGDPAVPESYRSVITSNIFDCYADGAFISLPETNGNATFRLEVFAYNAGAYEAARGQLDAVSTIGRARTDEDRARLEALTGELRGTNPTWTTQCSATQQQNVQALASCRPLGAGLAGVGGTTSPTTLTLATEAFVLPDGRAATCAALPAADGGVADAGDADAVDDAGVDDAGEPDDAAAPDAAVPDAGEDAGAPPVVFAKVRVRTRRGAAIVADATVTCPAPYTLEVGAEPATYDLDVALLDADGSLVDPGAQTRCEAAIDVGRESSAVCR